MLEPMMEWAEDIWSFPRSITGNGVRETIHYLQELIPNLEMHYVPSGQTVFDWVIPDEYFIESAHISTVDGRRLVDYADNNLHVVGYSDPVKGVISRDILDKHLYSDATKPDAIPYITSYYKSEWGFCVTHNQRECMTDSEYYVEINSKKFKGFLNYADIIIPGKTNREVLLSTYICHPMMANDNISGIVVAAALARWIQSQSMNLTYRIVFVPETIGSIAYLYSRLGHMKKNTVAGYVITCCGDQGPISIVKSPSGATLSDRAALAVLAANDHQPFKVYNFIDRGSDERQYCWPGIDLPVCAITRTKFGEYREYHTSLDNLGTINNVSLNGTLSTLKKCISSIDNNATYIATTLCEPHLSRYGAYPSTSPNRAPDILNVLALSNGCDDAIECAQKARMPFAEFDATAKWLCKAGLLKTMEQ
jgi:aminopeptidase-like protein